ncbi:MAG: glycosyltransferase family 39 protein [Acidobacteria bacterium]|nr:glycosyltransferase family 39 protein [Acidobacteriota bacterium]
MRGRDDLRVLIGRALLAGGHPSRFARAILLAMIGTSTAPRPIASENPLDPPSPMFERGLLLLILMAALAVRLRHHLAGVPFAAGIDEPLIVGRALRILQTGDWNTHAWNYPSLVIYLHALDAGARYLLGVLRGEWNSLSRMNIAAVFEVGRVVTALVGTATVWITYRIGRDLDSPRLGLAAAAMLAVLPMHVRESHFMLTDVPMTALTTLSVWLAIRAGQDRTVSAYAWAGVAAGLSAAAKYNGGVVSVAVVIAWLVFDRSSSDRARKAAAAVGATAVAFLVGAPYTLLDLPNFLEGFGAEFGKFATKGRSPAGDPVWLIYYKHLALSAWFWMPTAGAGVFLVLARKATQARWLIPVGFAVVYSYVLATHGGIVFARYALPLAPMVCLLAAAPIVAIARVISLYAAPGKGKLGAAFAICATLVFVVQFGVGSARWLQAFQRPDTRTVASTWLWGHSATGSRVAVENNGPTYLGSAGLDVTLTERIIDRPLESYVKDGFDYLVISTEGINRYDPYLQAGPQVFHVSPDETMWGPDIRIIKLPK